MPTPAHSSALDPSMPRQITNSRTLIHSTPTPLPVRAITTSPRRNPYKLPVAPLPLPTIMPTPTTMTTPVSHNTQYTSISSSPTSLTSTQEALPFQPISTSYVQPYFYSNLDPAPTSNSFTTSQWTPSTLAPKRIQSKIRPTSSPHVLSTSSTAKPDFTSKIMKGGEMGPIAGQDLATNETNGK